MSPIWPFDMSQSYFTTTFAAACASTHRQRRLNLQCPADGSSNFLWQIGILIWGFVDGLPRIANQLLALPPIFILNSINVCFCNTALCSSRAQRKSGFRRFCGKTPCCWRRKWCLEEGASAFPIRLCTFAAVQERSWLVCGGFGQLRRGGIRHLRRMGHVIGAAPARECV